MGLVFRIQWLSRGDPLGRPFVFTEGVLAKNSQGGYFARAKWQSKEEGTEFAEVPVEE